MKLAKPIAALLVTGLIGCATVTEQANIANDALAAKAQAAKAEAKKRASKLEPHIESH